MSWEVLLSIISILIAALSIISWFLIEQWKERRRLKEKHFTEIKDKCFKPLHHFQNEDWLLSSQT
jgi:hypothetical protein